MSPLDTSARIFTIVLILVGVASVIYALSGFADLLIESSISRFIHRRRERNVERMTGHTIVCGYGRTGHAVTRLLPTGTSVGIIELDGDEVDAAIESGLVAIEGDCTRDETLIAAGIDRAARLIVCLSSDSDAISTVLSAKVLNPNILVVTRVSDAASTHKLRLAGADHVVSPIEMGAQRLVADALHPSVGSFLDAALHDKSIGLTIRSVLLPQDVTPIEVGDLESTTGVRIIGIQDAQGQVIETVKGGHVASAAQTLLVVGRPEELAAVERYASSTPA